MRSIGTQSDSEARSHSSDDAGQAHHITLVETVCVLSKTSSRPTTWLSVAQCS